MTNNKVLIGRVLVGTAVALVAASLVPTTAAQAAAGDRVDLSIVATTDVHGNVFNWDYFRNQAYAAGSEQGLTRTSAAIDEIRAEKGAESVITLDNGDAIQGTPLTYYYGMGAGRADVLSGKATHPMAEAFNAAAYDAQVVGNHEYNYGLDLLDAYQGQLNAPLLGANVINVATGEPDLDPYTIIERTIDGKKVQIGVIGVVTPGIRIWDKANVEGKLEFRDPVETLTELVPEVQEKADVVVVLAHTGKDDIPDAGYDPSQLYENTGSNIARMVPGIDVLVLGHTHVDDPEEIVTNNAGGKVIVTQPTYWARSLSEVDLSLVEGADGDFDVDWSAAEAPTVTPHYTKGTSAESDAVVGAVQEQHQTAIDYVNQPVAESLEELSAATSRYEDTPIIDFINNVQQETVTEALKGTEYEDLPVISQASPFSRTAVFPKGQVSIRDIAGLYIYENTLRGVTLTGAQLRDYLEYSAQYFNQVEDGATFDPETGTNAVLPGGDPRGIPDYNYDALSGVDYVIDISQPVGDRIRELTFPDGTPVADDDEVVLAVNNYRQSGGGSFPHVADAPVVYDQQQEIRQLLIDWASAKGTIDAKDFFEENWQLVTHWEAPSPSPTPSVSASVKPSSSATPSASEAPLDEQPATPVGGNLADTGSDLPAWPVGAAVALIGAGAVAVVRGRRR